MSAVMKSAARRRPVVVPTEVLSVEDEVRSEGDMETDEMPAKPPDRAARLTRPGTRLGYKEAAV